MPGAGYSHTEISRIQSINPLWYQLLIGKRFRWVRHATLVCCFLFIMIQPDKNTPANADPVDVFMTKLLFFLYFLGLIYCNVYILVPRYLVKGRLTGYLISVFIVGLITFIIAMIIQNRNQQLQPLNIESGAALLAGLLTFLIIYSMIMAASASIKLFQKWVQSIENFVEVQQSNFKHELGMLRSQINPHFLFNTLNNVHVLIQSDPDRASGMVLSLSDLLRYQIYDCGEESVFLSEDIRFLNDFLTLEQSRRDEFSFEIKRSGDEKDVQIAPLLFIPFVENAIKHNHDQEAPSYVNVSVRLQNNLLVFDCTNSKPVKKSTGNRKQRGGIGLNNIRKRLSLLYPNRHRLIINESDDVFHVKLEINL